MAWAKLHDSCRSCGTTSRPHRAKGLCRTCYGRQPDVATRHEQRRQRRTKTPEGRQRIRERYRNDARYRRRIKTAAWLGGMRRRALANGCLVLDVTEAQLLARIDFYGGRCWMCGAAWEHIDHVKPLNKQGPHMLANLRPACGSCNSRKHERWCGVGAVAALRHLARPPGRAA